MRGKLRIAYVIKVFVSLRIRFSSFGLRVERNGILYESCVGDEIFDSKLVIIYRCIKFLLRSAWRLSIQKRF